MLTAAIFGRVGKQWQGKNDHRQARGPLREQGKGGRDARFPRAFQSGSLFSTLASVSLTSSPSNGRLPVSISDSTQPNAQMSLRLEKDLYGPRRAPACFADHSLLCRVFNPAGPRIAVRRARFVPDLAGVVDTIANGEWSRLRAFLRMHLGEFGTQ